MWQDKDLNGVMHSGKKNEDHADVTVHRLGRDAHQVDQLKMSQVLAGALRIFGF